jgi:LPXTG-site transpeptidase (sortase) family protein
MTALRTSSRARTQLPVHAGSWGEARNVSAVPDRALKRVAGSRWTRIGLPVLAVLCALAAAVALAFPQLSDWYARHEQQVLAGQLDDPAVGSSAGSTGSAVGRIDIPAKGPGHYPQSPMPCTLGNVAIAGHRTTFLHPFYFLDRMKVGDVISLRSRTLACTYRVTQPPFAVSPHNTSVVADTPGQYTLTLTTCNPRGSATQRLIVKAAMVGTVRTLRPPAAAHA